MAVRPHPSVPASTNCQPRLVQRITPIRDDDSQWNATLWIFPSNPQLGVDLRASPAVPPFAAPECSEHFASQAIGGVTPAGTNLSNGCIDITMDSNNEIPLQGRILSNCRIAPVRSGGQHSPHSEEIIRDIG
jgi:hypothetical protein